MKTSGNFFHVVLYFGSMFSGPTYWPFRLVLRGKLNSHS